MSIETQTDRFVEVRAQDEQELLRQVSSLRRDLCRRGAIVLDVELRGDTATLLYRVPSEPLPS